MTDLAPGKKQVEVVWAALAHPLRLWILQHVESTGLPVSPKEMMEESGMPLSDVGYHVRFLTKSGMLTLSGTKAVRGSRQHFYVASDRSRRPLVRALLILRGSRDLDDTQGLCDALCVGGDD